MILNYPLFQKLYKIIALCAGIILFVILSVVNVKSQINSNYNIKCFTVDQGLPHNIIHYIMKDNVGFLWIATEGGLSRFDGYTYQNFKSDPNDSNSLSYNAANCIIQQNDSIFWVSTFSGGLNRLNILENKFKRFTHNTADPNSLSTNELKCIAPDNKNNLWIGTRNNGLVKYDMINNVFEKYGSRSPDNGNLARTSVENVCVYNDTLIFISTFNGLYCLNTLTDKIKYYTHNEYDKSGLYNNSVYCVYKDTRNVLWVGTLGNGLQKFNPLTETFETKKLYYIPKEREGYNGISHITEDDNNNLLLTTAGNGNVIKFNTDSDTYTLFDLNELIKPESKITQINYSYFDHSNVLWVGTWNMGLVKLNLNRNNFTNYSLPDDGLNKTTAKDVWSIYEDSKGFLWISTNRGILLFDKSTKEYVKTFSSGQGTSSLNINHINKICEDKNGDIWIATWGGGLNRYDRKTGKFRYYKNNKTDYTSLSSDLLRYIYCDREGIIWCATVDKGFCKYNPDSDNFTRYYNTESDINSVSYNDVSFIYEDKNGFLWLGTWNGGLNKFDKKTGKCKRYYYDVNNPKSIPSDYVLCGREDGKGNLWIGTSNGLCKYLEDEDKFQNYHDVSEKGGNSVFDIIPDKNNNLWLATNQGISKFNILLSKFRNYTQVDGSLKIEYHTSFLMTKENIIYAGSEKGFTSFNPDELNDEQNLSPVTITSFKKFNQESDVLKRQLKNGEITLSFSEDVFSFEFSLLDFKNPEEYNYAYKIDGLDKDWIYSGNNRTAAYSHLQPGNYTFSVKASNADGIWNVPATVKLVIVPPFWRTWWFISVSVLMFLASGIVYFKLRENRLKKSNIALENTVGERTKDLIDANENLKNEIIERKKAEASIQYSKEQYKLLVENANEAIIVLQDDIVVYYNPSAVEMLCSDSEELYRKNFREFIYPDYTETFFTDYLNTLRGEPVNDIKELKLVKRKSEMIEVEMNSLLIEWIDKKAALIFFKDVTERKRAEKKTENALIKEKELSELRSRFISMASHEFKTPLTSINTSVELLEKYDKSLTEDKKINSLQRIKKNVTQMTRLLNDVLEIGKSESGKLDIQKEKIEIGKFLKEMLEELEGTITARTQHSIISSLLNTDTTVYVDPKLIRQVVENLLSNAVKYSETNTEIFFGAEIKDGTMIIKVKDSGIGILPEDMKRLFEPFFRGYNHGNAAGTGLGLTIMKSAVDAHGGRIEVNSEVNKGTEFSVFIPV